MRLIHRYLLAAAVTAMAHCAASAQVRDDRYSGVTGSIPPAAIASPAGGPDWSGESGSSGDPRMTAAAIRAAAANFRWLPRSPVAAGGAARHFAQRLCRLYRGADAGPAHHGSARRAAGIYQVVLGLSRSLGERRAYRAGPRAACSATARPSMRWNAPTALTAISSPRSGAWRPTMARSAAIVR